MYIIHQVLLIVSSEYYCTASCACLLFSLSRGCSLFCSMVVNATGVASDDAGTVGQPNNESIDQMNESMNLTSSTDSSNVPDSA